MAKIFELIRKFFFSIPGKGFSSCILLLSSFFSIFSAVPAISTYVGESRTKGLYVLLIGAGLTFIIGGIPTGIVYVTIIFFSTVVLGELIRSKAGFGKVIVVSSLVIIGTYIAAFVVYSSIYSLNVMDLLVSKIKVGVDFMNINYPDIVKQTLMETGMSDKELVTSIAVKAPATIAVVIIIFVFINVLIAARLNEKLSSFMKFDNLMKTKISEHFVWPALVFGGLYLYTTTQYNTSVTLETVGLLLFKGVMMFYFLHGLMITYLITSLKIPQGFFRALLFSLIVVFAYLFVTALGFFDTWFDYRKYFNKKGEEQ